MSISFFLYQHRTCISSNCKIYYIAFKVIVK
jgi:hypothetical protein